MRVTKAKPDLAGLIGKAVLEALRKGGIETEGPKRGATIGSEVDSEHSDNEERDPEEGTLDGSAGEDNPKNSHRETTRRGVGKAAKPDNQDEEDMDDEDEEDGDGEEATPPPKAKGKASKAKKVATSEDDEDNLTKSELVELIATTVVGTLQGLGVVNKADGTEDDDAVGKIASRARRPAVFAVGKGDDGRVGKADGAAEQAGDPLELALQKSLGTRNLTPILKNDGSVDQPASLIKHILSGRPMKSVTADSLSEAK